MLSNNGLWIKFTLLNERQAHVTKRQGLVEIAMDIMASHFEPIYCQSKEKLRKPRPSLLSVPPNRFVNMSTVLGDAFWLARQKMLIPFNNGNMYAGIISYMNIPVNAVQKSLTRLWLIVTVLKCNAMMSLDAESKLSKRISTLKNRNSR